jgi:hypothetical protein
MSYYLDHGTALDWEASSIASTGFAEGIGAHVYFFEFRSRSANCRAYFAFVGASIGEGGGLSFSGGSPGELIHNTDANAWSLLQCNDYFSLSDLDLSVGQIWTGGGALYYGYSLCFIAAGLFPVLFSKQSCSGWGSGLGVQITGCTGFWKQISSSDLYA